MPLVAPIMKVQACRQYGANVIVKGKDIGECRVYALRMAKEQGLLYVNGYVNENQIGLFSVSVHFSQSQASLN